MPYRAIQTNIADSLDVIIQMERRPGTRFVSEVLEIRGYDPETDRCSSEWPSSRHINGIQSPTQGTRFRRYKEEQRNEHPNPSNTNGGESCRVDRRLGQRRHL